MSVSNIIGLKDVCIAKLDMWSTLASNDNGTIHVNKQERTCINDDYQHSITESQGLGAKKILELKIKWQDDLRDVGSSLCHEDH